MNCFVWDHQYLEKIGGGGWELYQRFMYKAPSCDGWLHVVALNLAFKVCDVLETWNKNTRSWWQCSLQKFSYTWCKMNKCQLAKNLHMVLINLHLVLAILFGLQCVLKVWIYTWWYGSGTSSHMVVVPFINVTLGARTKCVIPWRESCAHRVGPNTICTEVIFTLIWLGYAFGTTCRLLCT